MRTILTLLTALTLPGAALAQVMPAGAPINRGPMVQYPSNSSFHGITVNGQATQKTAATSAKITLYLYSQQLQNQPVRPLDETRLAPLIDALVKGGVPREQISIPSMFGPQPSGSVTVIATLAHPTPSQIQNGIGIVAAALSNMRGVMIGNAQVLLESSQCGAVGDAVRGEAIDNAHKKAASVAKQLGVHLGNVLNVNATDQGYQNGTCAWPYNMGPNNLPQITSPDDWVSIPVFSSVTITYAIKH